MSYETISIEQVQRVAIVTLNRPEVLNALNLQLVRELDEAIINMVQDEDVGAIVITGAGERAFSAGADIHENREKSQEERDEAAAERAEYTWRMASCPKPIIGAVNGLCYGGGTVMATSMDFLIGCDNSSFRFLAVNYGPPPDECHLEPAQPDWVAQGQGTALQWPRGVRRRSVPYWAVEPPGPQRPVDRQGR